MGIETGLKLLENYHAEVVFIDERRDIFLTKGIVHQFTKYTKEIKNGQKQEKDNNIKDMEEKHSDFIIFDPSGFICQYLLCHGGNLCFRNYGQIFI